MKTAAAPVARTSAATESKGGGARRPFFRADAGIQRQASDAPVQARFSVGRPGDRYEVEADRVADRVVDGKPATLGLSGGITPLAQRREDEEPLQAKTEQALPAREEEEVQTQGLDDEETQQAPLQAKAEQDAAPGEQPELQAKHDEPDVGEEEPLQARTDDKADEEAPGDAIAAQRQPQEEEVQARGSGTQASAETARQIRAAHGGGNPLPGPLRDKLEAQFDADFSGVRIHTDAPAVLLAQTLKAQAFTRGSDIFFNAGRFSPESRAGRHLLAHELTHTIQQGAVRQGEEADTRDGTPQPEADEQDVIRLAPENADDSYQVRPEIVEATRLARGEIGKVNAKKSGPDGKRIGWERLREYFSTAFGGTVVSEQVIDRVTTIEKTGADGKTKKMDALPSWCGIFTWWAMKKAGIPIPDWKLGAPALDAMRLRPSGELPRKGDIAIDVQPYNHFGMVTGLESSKDAEGKPLKLTRVATINGNTAGEDNLGGQVQERWDDLKRWDHFFDPVGKLNLPEVPLVTVGREPEPLTPAGETAAAPAAQATGSEAAPEPGAREPGQGLDTLYEGVAPPPDDLMGGALPEPDLSLPPPADTGPAEQVAVVEKMELSGSSDAAATQFIDASPSAMAATQPALGPTINGKMQAEQADLAHNPPVLEARTSGAADVPLTGAAEIPIPGDTQLGEGVSGPDPGHIAPAPQTAAEPYRGNAVREKELEQEDSGSFWDRFTSFLRKFVKGIRTTDDSVATSAGARPAVALSGEADPGRMDTPRADATTAMKQQRDSQVEAFRNHPGQANIQPRRLDEQRPVVVSAGPAASIDPLADDNVAAYAAAPLPQDVRDAADVKVARTLKPNLAEARSQTVDAASVRDDDKQREIDTAQQAAARLNADTDAAQRKLVIENRGKVAKLQGEGVSEAYDHVNAFNKDAASEQTAARKAIGEHVKSEEGKAKTELEQGEKDAEKKKADAEREAADKKAELEKEQEKESWWDHAKGFIKKAVKAVTEAIDKVFTAMRDAVKTIIDKAKNAAIGLINKARDWVVDKLNKFRDWAKSQVDKYLKDTFPGLAKRINGAIDAVTDVAVAGVNYVADKAIEGVTKLADGLAAALDKILATFQTALKTAVRVVGAVMQGDFAEALRAAIEGACEIAGVDSKPVFQFLDRAGKAIMSILKDPVSFIRKLFGAVGDGIGSFFKNIKTHLIQGVIGWLTGALAEVNLTGPFEFTPKGILSIVLQILGLTYANIKARVIKKVPAAAKVFDVVEKGFVLLKKLVVEGPSALWEEIKSRVASLKETVMGAIRNWLITTVIKEGIVWLLSLTNPASAIVKAVKLVFDLVMFLVERYQQIKDFVMSVYESVAAVAAGNFTKVTTAVENALARVVPVLISLLASLIGLGGIAKQVKKVIETITKPINKAIDWVIDKIVAFAKKVIAKIKGGAKKAKEKAKETVEKLVSWWKERRKFRSRDGGDHSIYYSGEGKQAQLMVASNPDRIENFLDKKIKDGSTPADQKQTATEAMAQYKIVLKSEDDLEKLRAAREKVPVADKANYRAATSAVNSEIRNFRNQLDALKRILEKATFENEDDALVRTNVTHNGGGDKSTVAMPLTYLSGNTKGSSPSQDPPGWAHAVALDTKPDGTSYHQWVRGHLLNDNLHGPGTADNLVPITQGMNRKMEAEVESPAKSAIKTKGKLYFYRAVATFWKKPAPIDVFPQKIVVTWGDAERDAADKNKFKEKSARPPVVVDMGSPPPETATAFVPSINGGSPSLLLNAISKHDKAVTYYFVSELLLSHNDYKSKDDMQARLLKDIPAGQEAARRRYVTATYNAVTKGDVRV